MNHSRNVHQAQPFQTVINFEGTELLVKSIILPATPAPHVGADSPRFLEPGRAASVIHYSLFDDYGSEVTGYYFLDRERADIEKLILEEWRIDQTGERLIARGVLRNSPTLAEVNFRRGYPEGEPA